MPNILLIKSTGYNVPQTVLYPTTFLCKKKEKRKKKIGGSEDKHDDGNACQKLG